MYEKLHSYNIAVTMFREPDIDNQATSIAVEPSEKAARLLSNLPLALKEFNQDNLISKNSGKEICNEDI